MLIIIETYTTCDFPGGEGPEPLSPLCVRTWDVRLLAIAILLLILYQLT